MIPRGEFDAYDRALSTNADMAAEAVLALEADLGALSGEELVAALDAEYPRLVTEYGVYAAACAVEFYEAMREEAEAEGAYEAFQYYPKDWGLLRADVSAEAVDGREAARVLKGLAARSQQRVMAYADETLVRNAQADPAHPRWAIVPHAGACPWCVMLGSNGFMYRSEGSANAARHPSCKCAPVVDFDARSPSLAGYDPAAMRSAYRSCRDAVAGDARRRWESMGAEERARYTRNGKASYDAYLRNRVAAEMATRDRGWLQTGKAPEITRETGAKPLGKEREAARALAEGGFSVRFIKEANTTGVKSPDAYLGGEPWEFKVPEGWSKADERSIAGEHTVRKQFYKALGKGTKRLLLSNGSNGADYKAVLAAAAKTLESGDFDMDEVLVVDPSTGKITRLKK